MLIYLLLLYVLCPQNEVSAAAAKSFSVTAHDLKRLDELKYYLCGMSHGYSDPGGMAGYWRGIGWFCMAKENCTGQPQNYVIQPGTESDFKCDALRYNEGRDTCCFVDQVTPKFHFPQPLDPDWDVYLYTRNTTQTRDLAEMEEHRNYFFRIFLRGEDSDLELALKNHEVCSLQPVGFEPGRTPNGDENGKTSYTPYICVSKQQCEGEKHANVDVDIKFPYGDRFCKRSTNPDTPVCCHISTAIPLDKKQDWWKFIELPETQKYAPGFRAKFMCENYNKYVCDGEADRCAQKVLHRKEFTLPGEFPHHALVGISLPRRQTFHCQGAIISKVFVLSSYDCRQYESTLANVVLLGTFNFELESEVTDKEQFVYIKNHISQMEKHWFLLLKLWRPVRLSPFIRPACIDWYSSDRDLNSKNFDFGTGWILSYGPKTVDGNWSTNVTRFNFKYNFIDPDENTERLCKARIPDLKKKYFSGTFTDSKNHICVQDYTVYSPRLDQQILNAGPKNYLGYFSNGASFSVFERYCQWKVYGIYTQDKHYENIPPLLIETVPYALAWIEDIVWGHDFDLLFFNLSWPECADWENPNARPRRKGGEPNEALHQFNFYTEDYLYVKPQYNRFYGESPR